METLLSGGYIVKRSTNDLTYNLADSSEDNLWDMLYQTGYLTQVRPDSIKLDLKVPKNYIALEIPNRESRTLFSDGVIEHLKEQSKIWDKDNLISAVWNNIPRLIANELTKLLHKTINYYEMSHNFYRDFLTEIFTGARYTAYSETLTDVVIYDNYNGRCTIFEVIYSNKSEHLNPDCETALRQMDDKHYISPAVRDYDVVVYYGIFFYQKQCLVMSKN